MAICQICSKHQPSTSNFGVDKSVEVLALFVLLLLFPFRVVPLHIFQYLLIQLLFVLQVVPILHIWLGLLEYDFDLLLDILVLCLKLEVLELVMWHDLPQVCTGQTCLLLELLTDLYLFFLCLFIQGLFLLELLLSIS